MPRVSMLWWAGGTLLAVVAVLIVFLEVIDVDRKIPADFSRGDQCEKLNVDGTILEPQNTWSNVVYVLAGLMIFYRGRRLRSIVVGLFLCLTGVFSALYHAVPTNGTLQTLDIAAVNWVLLAMVGYAVLSLDFHFYATERDVVWEKLIAIVSFVLGAVMAITRTKFPLFESTIATVSLVVVLVALLFWGFFTGKGPKTKLSKDEKIIYVTVVVLIALPTAACRLLDGIKDGAPKALCKPDGILGLVQAHAVWHVLSAVLLLVAFDYFTRLANQSNERIFAD